MRDFCLFEGFLQLRRRNFFAQLQGRQTPGATRRNPWTVVAPLKRPEKKILCVCWSSFFKCRRIADTESSLRQLFSFLECQKICSSKARKERADETWKDEGGSKHDAEKTIDICNELLSQLIWNLGRSVDLKSFVLATIPGHRAFWLFWNITSMPNYFPKICQQKHHFCDQILPRFEALREICFHGHKVTTTSTTSVLHVDAFWNSVWDGWKHVDK